MYWSSDVCSSDLLRHQEALRGAGAGGFGVAVLASLEDVRQVVFRVLLRRQNRWVHAFAGMTGGGAELVIGQQRIALVVQRVAVGLHVVEPDMVGAAGVRSEEHTSELQSLMRISYAVFCLKKKKSQHSVFI